MVVVPNLFDRLRRFPNALGAYFPRPGLGGVFGGLVGQSYEIAGDLLVHLKYRLHRGKETV